MNTTFNPLSGYNRSLYAIVMHDIFYINQQDILN